MTYVLLGAAGLLVAALAAVWPSLHAAPSRTSVINRAEWVNRLFALAAQADAAGESRVAAAARSLISTLVLDTPVGE